jgi:uncharacterized protein (DUF342 family)
VVTLENVDYSTGNITFDGSVVVKGTIADGFSVDAGGSVQVENFVGKVNISSGRSILLKSGVNGAGECEIRCEGDVLARYIENASVRCSGNLVVEEAVMHSDISVGGNFLLTGGRAELLAGRSIVGGSLWCRKLGNLAEVRTYVRLGVEPEIIELSEQLRTAISSKREELNQQDAELKHLAKRIKSRKMVSEDEAKQLKKLNTSVRKTSRDLKRLQARFKRVNEAMMQESDCMLVLEQVMYHGVTVVFGDIEYPVPLKGIRKTIFKVKDDRIVESGFNPYNAPKFTFKDS